MRYKAITNTNYRFSTPNVKSNFSHKNISFKLNLFLGIDVIELSSIFFSLDIKPLSIIQAILGNPIESSFFIANYSGHV